MSNSFYVFVESLKSTYQAGGVVMLPILLVGTVGFYYLFYSWFRIGSDFFRQDVQKVIKNLGRNLDRKNVYSFFILNIVAQCFFSVKN